MTLCSWVPASGLVLLEECVICTESLWGLRVGACSGPRGLGMGEGGKVAGTAARSLNGG